MTEAKREMIALRVTPAALEQVDKIAEQFEWTRSQVVRKLLTLGLKAWAKGERT